jgi:hypothetical protein
MQSLKVFTSSVDGKRARATTLRELARAFSLGGARDFLDREAAGVGRAASELEVHAERGVVPGCSRP